MYFMLDNYDSFVYNLSAYFKELGQEILVRREEESTLSEIEETFKKRTPILGVCLGHQAIGHYFGACVKKGARPMHGKLTEILHQGRGLFAKIPQGFRATRYHSLLVSWDGLPGELVVDAVSGEGVIMGISHRRLPVYGVQFHPEAVLTEYGPELLENFTWICRKWRGDV